MKCNLDICFFELFVADDIGEADTDRPRHAVQCRTLCIESEYFDVIKHKVKTDRRLVVLAVATDIFGSIRC